MNLSPEQLGRLLFKSACEPRRNQKRYLKDLGGTGSAEELDAVLAQAQDSAEARAECDRLQRQRTIIAQAVHAVDGRVAEMLADIRLHMQDQGLTQQDVATRCGWPQSLVAAYLTGKTEPGIGNLAKLATALGRVWRLSP